MAIDSIADYVMGATMGVVSFIAVTGTVRALVLFAKMKYVHKKRFSHISFLFINLIITDFICGLFNASFMSLNLVAEQTIQRNTTMFEVFCNMNGISDVLATQASVLLNAIMSYGRYIAVCKSLRYNTLITTKKIYIAVGVAWIYSIYLAVLPYMWSVTYQYFGSISVCSWYNAILTKVEGKPLQAFLFLAIISLPSLVPATIVMVCCSLIIYQLISAASGANQGLYGLRILFCNPFTNHKTNEAAARRDLQHAKRMELVEAARSVLKIVLVFVFCNFAWWVKMLSDVLEFCDVIPLHWWKNLIGHATNDYFNRVLKMLVVSNSAITPFLYSFSNTKNSNKPSSASLTTHLNSRTNKSNLRRHHSSIRVVTGPPINQQHRPSL